MGLKQQKSIDRSIEKAFINNSEGVIIGVDEAGRGPLAGPVIAAACYVDDNVDAPCVQDSKKMTEAQREDTFNTMSNTTNNNGIYYALGQRSPLSIDCSNILKATMDSMTDAVYSLIQKMCVALSEGKLTNISKEFVCDTANVRNTSFHLPFRPNILIDGNIIPKTLRDDNRMNCQAIVKGDSKAFSIGAASILAKVSRDRLMKGFHDTYPLYGFIQNKGYPTKSHQQAILLHGVSPIHRLTFDPIKSGILNNKIKCPEGRSLLPTSSRCVLLHNKNNNFEKYTRKRAKQSTIDAYFNPKI